MIAEALERDGHATDIAANGLIALGKLASRSYDLILSDTKMPVLDGESLYAELARRFPQLRQRVISSRPSRHARQNRSVSGSSAGNGKRTSLMRARSLPGDRGEVEH